MPLSPKVIFFDAAGTLIYLPRTVGEHYREVALAFGIEADAEALDRAFRSAWKAAPPRPAGVGPRPDDDKGWWRQLVERVFAEVLRPAERRAFDMANYFEAVYAHFAKPGVWEAYPEARETLRLLQSDGLRLGVISNFDRRLRTVLAGLGLAPFFERVVISSEVGADKPDPSIFRHALAGFGVTAAEAVHVGDDPEKDGGATAAGLRVFRLARPGHTLADVRPFLAAGADA